MWLLAWTMNRGGNDLPDFWVIHETEAQALAQYAELQAWPNLHCAAVAKIGTATEPHWTDEVAA